MLLASAIDVPEFVIDEDEAKQLGTAIANVSRHYNVAPSEKITDWCMLFIALGIIYAPRFYAIREKRKTENKNKETNNVAFA